MAQTAEIQQTMPKAGAERRSGLVGLRAALAAAAGNLLEWYDFTVYAYFAILIGKAFFPGADATTALVQAFLTFGLGFLVRPAGAVLMGAYADRHGRKAALTATILLMAAGTLVIALAPPASAIGIGAPLLLVAGRSLQGFSAGGEVGGALTFMVEHAPPGRRGLYASLLQASMAGSNVLGSLVGFALTSLLAPAELAAWGWRVAFLIGVLIAPVGLWLRRTLGETPEFSALAASAPRPSLSAAARAAFARPGRLLAATGLSTLWTAGSYALAIYFPIYVQAVGKASPRSAFAASLTGSVVLVFACLAGGRLADRIDRRLLLTAVAVMLAVVPHFLLRGALASPDLATLTLVQSAICLMVGLFNGAAPSALAALFPVGSRASGTSVGYNLAVMLFGGFAPTILTWLIGRGLVFAPAWYVSAAALLSLPALFVLAPCEPPLSSAAP
ncbi:MFS transporter [Novosphingobium flavum]|uniref:MFS transporter n=1 Tax=Novosphingobium flavum TaxID=1778672 RepID=A0A7X1FNN1_9SPHN|nr:MFS transporter [Novosphingobium flavum]MBC2664028.1 MFS transporter [Novosphingobium flavum]